MCSCGERHDSRAKRGGRGMDGVRGEQKRQRDRSDGDALMREEAAQFFERAISERVAARGVAADAELAADIVERRMLKVPQRDRSAFLFAQPGERVVQKRGDVFPFVGRWSPRGFLRVHGRLFPLR